MAPELQPNDEICLRSGQALNFALVAVMGGRLKASLSLDDTIHNNSNLVHEKGLEPSRLAAPEPNLDQPEPNRTLGFQQSAISCQPELSDPES